MKRAILLMLALLLALGLTAALAEGDLLSTITGRGYITVGTEGEWAPWTFHDPQTNALVGFDVEVAQAIAEKLGIEARFNEAPWDALLSGLGTRHDIMANGVEISPEREEAYTFSEPYAYIRTALIVRADNTDITTFEDLKGKKTTNSIGSTYATLAEQYGATVTPVETLAETIEALLRGSVDATLNADVSFYDYLAQHPEAPVKVVALTEEASRVAIPMPKGAETLKAAIDEAIAALREEGILSAISVKYFGNDITALPEAE